MLTIGTLQLQNWLVMAPMAGISNLAFRLIVKRQGAGLVTSEMVSAMGLTRGQKKSFQYLKTHPHEKPLAVQIFGSMPDVMAAAAEIVIDAGADIVDLNMGCPVRKVIKTGSGAALLNNPSRTKAIVTAVRKACTVPLTAKLRTGWYPDRPVVYDVGRVLEDAGIDAITLHARAAVQGYSGKADWNAISKLKKNVKIPVIGNGDVLRPEMAFEMRKRTACDGVMIGRGAVGRPWIFKQILDMDQGRQVKRPTLEERKTFILEHFRLLCHDMGEPRASKIMRGMLLWYTKGLPNSTHFRATINRIKDIESLIFTLEKYFKQLEDTNI